MTIDMLVRRGVRGEGGEGDIRREGMEGGRRVKGRGIRLVNLILCT